MDGCLLGTAPVADDAFTAALPPFVMGHWITVTEPRTGQALLAQPYDYTPHRTLKWHSWSLGAGRIEGQFSFEGLDYPGPDQLIPVELVPVDLFRPAPYALAFAEPDGDAWRFTQALPALPALHEKFEVKARVGGVTVASEPLAVAVQACGYAGYVDSTEGVAVTGWAVDLTHPDQAVKVEMRVNGRAVAHSVARDPRPDLLELGFGNGHSAFQIAYPRDLPRDRDLTIGIVLAGTETHLANSPFVRGAQAPYIGYFDAVEGPFAGGWVVNMRAPDEPLMVEAICEGAVIGAGLANLYRGDVESAGLPTARCGFRFLLDRPVAALFDRDIVMRIVGTDEIIQGSPRQVMQNANITRFLARTDTITPQVLHRLARRMTHTTAATGISIIMPVFNTKREWLVQALNSVIGQWSAHWELICVDDGSTAPHVAEILDAAAKFDPRIRVLRSPGNAGIARATNFGLRAARGAYVAFMDHDDVIEPDAVYRLAQAAQSTNADLVYSDEAITTEDISSVVEVRARPAFSWDYYVSHPYFVHMIAVRTNVARSVAGWDEAMPISADVDFVLRVIEASKIVTHVPAVLYRWRTHGGSAGHAKQGQVTAAMLGALQRHLTRRELPATVAEGFRYNEYRIDWPDDGGEVLIVIPTKNRVDLLKTCIDSIERTSSGAQYRIVVIDHDSTDPKTRRYLAKIKDRITVMPYSGPFNYALMNNLAVRTHGDASRYVLFLNNDVEATEPGWIPRMRSLAARPEVGAVGPLLLYGDDRIQHAGVLVGFSGAADHAMKFINAYLSKGQRHPGYNCNLTTVRDYSAVTAACVMIRMDVFQAVGGFDEGFVVGFNDTDLCLRIGEAGFKVLYDGFTVLYHHESATRTESKSVDHPEDDLRLRTRWQRFFTEGDPFYSPLLAPKGTDHTLRLDAGCKGRMRPRPVSTILSTGVSVAKPTRTKRKPARVPA